MSPTCDELNKLQTRPKLLKIKIRLVEPNHIIKIYIYLYIFIFLLLLKLHCSCSTRYSSGPWNLFFLYHKIFNRFFLLNDWNRKIYILISLSSISLYHTKILTINFVFWLLTLICYRSISGIIYCVYLQLYIIEC